MSPTIFTTGAFLQPTKIKNVNGTEYWIWAVTEFIDDSFNNGEVYNPKEYANTLEELLQDDSNTVLEKN